MVYSLEMHWVQNHVMKGQLLGNTGHGRGQLVHCQLCFVLSIVGGDRSTEETCIVCATAVTNWLQPICVSQIIRHLSSPSMFKCFHWRVFSVFSVFYLFFICVFLAFLVSRLCRFYFQSSRKAAIFSIFIVSNID